MQNNYSYIIMNGKKKTDINRRMYRKRRVANTRRVVFRNKE